MATEARLANTPITSLDPSLSSEVLYERLVYILTKNNIDEVGFLPFLPDINDCNTTTASTSDNNDTYRNDNNNGCNREGETLPQYPFAVQEQGTKLGIPIFCWVPLLEESYRIYKATTVRAPSTESRRDSEWWEDPERRQRVIESTSCLMILCPDSFSAMNARKRLVEGGHLDPRKEMQFLDMILTFPRNCKSSGAWHHRKWLLCYMYKDHTTVPLPPSEIREQLKVCHLAAERYPKCYYAWSMRHWLVEQLGRHWWNASLQADNAPIANAPIANDGDLPETLQHVSQFQQLSCDSTGVTQRSDRHSLQPLLEEFERMKNHMRRNVSDHSTQQHLQQCMIQLSGKWIVQRVQSNQSCDPSQSNGSPIVVLQWTRSSLATRRQRKDQWFREHQERSNHGDKTSAVVYKSAIKSAVAAMKTNVLDDDTWTTDVLDTEGIQPASFPWVVSLWISELRRTHDLIRSYPGHESLWYHLRFVYYGLRWLDCETDFGDLEPSSCGVDEALNKDEGLLASLGSVDSLLPKTSSPEDGDVARTANANTLSEVLEKQLDYANKYLTWVHRLDVEPDTDANANANANANRSDVQMA
ncbi:MAG: hypothetical protein J3Q66DRAFT_42814 [Benniella sp.]|nr:MAG: hypothetical protein J3Q66DRAFT_42814 [Benniella sp.]